MIKVIKKQRSNILIISSIFIAVFFVAGAFLLVYQTPYSDAVDTTWGPPAHSHDGWPFCSTSGCSSSYTKHIQAELNWFDDNNNLPGFTIIDGRLGVDGDFGPATREAVKDFQRWVKNNWGDSSMLVDGIVGNQTWTHMEFQVLNTDSGPGRLPAGVGLKFPVYNECRKITNNTSLGIAAPLKTPGEWSAFKNSSITTNAAGDCTPSGGGSSGGSASSCISLYGSCSDSPGNCCSGLICTGGFPGFGFFCVRAP